MVRGAVNAVLVSVLLLVPTHEPAGKAAWASPSEPRLQAIDHVAADAIPPLSHTGSLPAYEAALLDGVSALPVLLPDDPGLLESAIVVTGPHWYSASMANNGYRVFVMGRAAAVHMEGLEVFVRPVVGVPTITRVHDIVTLTFTAFGATWDLDIECLGGIEHPMCGDDALAFDLVDRLRRLEGRR